MSEHPISLPEYEVFISRAALDGTTLLIRLVTDYHPGANPDAYSIEIEEPADPEAALAFLRRWGDDGEFVYAFVRDKRLVLQTEFGEEIEIAGRTLRATPSDFEAGELRQVADRVYQWYLSESHALGKANKRIEAARSLLFESARRVEIKAASHAEGGTAATLYAQQLALIRRILGTLES